MTLAWLADTCEPAEQSRLMRTAMHARWRRCRRSTVNQTASLRRQATTARIARRRSRFRRDSRKVVARARDSGIVQQAPSLDIL